MFPVTFPEGIMKSKTAKIPTWTVTDLGLDPGRVGLNGFLHKGRQNIHAEAGEEGRDA
jgi:hypothetical protein